MYKIRSYTKEDGSVGYEVYDTETNKPVARDDSYASVIAIKRGLEQEAA